MFAWFRRIILGGIVPAAFTLLYLPAIQGVPFYTKGEPREAVVVQSIVEKHEFILPLRNGDEIPSKPPLFHWLGAAISVAVGRVSETTVRIPSLAASLLALGLTMAAGLSHYGARTALLAVVLLATSQQWLASSTTARVDMVLAAAVTGALVAAWSALSAARDRLPAAFFACCALAVLAKGPVGYVLPALIVGGYLLLRRRRSDLLLLRPRRGAWILALPLLWYLLAWISGGQAFVDKLLLKENFYRVIDPDAVAAGHVHSPLYYLPALTGGFAPWSLLLPWVAVDVWRRWDRSDSNRLVFPAVWFLLTLAFYCLAGSKRGVYLLSAYPALALLSANWLSGWIDRAPAAPGSKNLTAAALAALIALVALIVGTQASGVPIANGIAPWLSRGDAANLTVVMESIERHSGLVALWASAALLLAAGLYAAARAGRRKLLLACAAAFVIATELVAASSFHRELAQRQTIAPLIEQTRGIVPPDQELYFYRGFEYAAVFYARRAIPRIDSVGELARSGPVWLLLRETQRPGLLEELAAAGDETRAEEFARYDVGGNSRRQPLLLLRVAWKQDDEQPG